MAKVQKISEISPNIPFTEYDFYKFYTDTFRRTELGRMYELIPFKQLVEDFGFKETPPSHVWSQALFRPRREDSTGIHRPRTKYIDVSNANMAYMKQRRHSHTQTRKFIRRELQLLEKILEEIRRMQRDYEKVDIWNDIDFSDIDIITKIYRQQNNHFKSDDTRESIPDRIVSIRKPYIRPIVRGKENKNVEFGAKCNNILHQFVYLP